MATLTQQQLIEQVFSDAHVIDVDFSEWDKSIRFCVIADHVDVPTPPRLPLFIVEFFRVHWFCCNFKHLGLKLEKPDQHVQWLIDTCDLRCDKDTITVVLSQSGVFPKVEIECESIECHRLDHTILDNLFPKWNKPYSGLARPGIQALVKLYRKSSDH